jgi:hypothetical protein
MQDVTTLKTVARCIPIKAGTRQSLAEQIEVVLNELSEEIKLTARIEVSTIASGGNFIHFAYIIYFESVKS